MVKLVPFRQVGKRLWGEKMLALLALIAFAFPATLVFLHSYETSPIDEWVFVDYTDKVYEQGFVHEGERVGTYTIELMACQGVLPGSKFGVCGAGTANYADLPYSGLTAAAAYTPAYFFLTRTLGLPFQFLGAEALTAWRLTGAIWLVAGIVAFVALLRAWGVSDRRIFPLALVAIASPYVWWAHSFVSTDAPSLFIGALLLLTATQIRRRLLNPWWFVLIATIAVALKVTNLVGVGLAVTYIVAATMADLIKAKKREDGPKANLWQSFRVPAIAGLAGASAVASQIFWAKFISATAISGERVDQGISLQLNPTELSLQVVNFLPSVLSYSPFSGHGKDFIWVPLSWIPIAGVIGSFFLIRKWNEKSYVVLAILFSSVAMAPLLAISVQVAQGAYFQLSPRYGASLIPAFLLCVAFILRNHFARILIILYALGLFAVGIYVGITLI